MNICERHQLRVFLPILASQGCAGGCRFCRNASVASKPVDEKLFLDVATRLIRHGVTNFYLADSCYFGTDAASRLWLLRAIIEQGKESGTEVKVRLQARTESLFDASGRLHPGLRELLSDDSIDNFFVGFESAAQTDLLHLGKASATADAVARRNAAIEVIDEAVPRLTLGTVFFHEATTLDTLNQNLEFMRELRSRPLSPKPYWYRLMILPATRMASRVSEVDVRALLRGRLASLPADSSVTEMLNGIWIARSLLTRELEAIDWIGQCQNDLSPAAKAALRSAAWRLAAGLATCPLSDATINGAVNSYRREIGPHMPEILAVGQRHARRLVSLEGELIREGYWV